MVAKVPLGMLSTDVATQAELDAAARLLGSVLISSIAITEIKA